VTGRAFSVVRPGGLSLVWRPRAAAVCAALALAGAVLCLVLLGTGTLAFTPAEVLGALTGGGDNATASRVVLRIRLPRVLTAILVGASLGMAGARPTCRWPPGRRWAPCCCSPPTSSASACRSTRPCPSA